MRIAPTLHRQPPRRYVITAIRLAAGVRMPVRPRRSALALFGLLSFSLSALPCAGQEVVPPSVYASPQQLIAVDGARRLNLYCVGSGRPTVLLDAGAGNGMSTWRFVQAEISKMTRVCAYDRAGLGFSDAAARPSDLSDMADDLHRLLKAAGIETPIVYVGHSLAGEIGVFYAARHPADIAGAVLVEPGFAGAVHAMEAELPTAQRTAIEDAFGRTLERERACLALARQGELAPAATEPAKACVDVGGDPDKSDAALKAVKRRLLALPRVWEAEISELESFVPKRERVDIDSAELQSVTPTFDDKPLIVLSRGVEEGGPGVPTAYLPRVEAAWRAGHVRLAALSSRGRHIIVPGARHYVQIDRPEAVIDAARRVLADVRSK